MAGVAGLCTLCSGRELTLWQVPLETQSNLINYGMFALFFHKKWCNSSSCDCQEPENGMKSCSESLRPNNTMPKSRYMGHLKHADHIGINRRVEGGEESYSYCGSFV